MIFKNWFYKIKNLKNNYNLKEMEINLIGNQLKAKKDNLKIKLDNLLLKLNIYKNKIKINLIILLSIKIDRL